MEIGTGAVQFLSWEYFSRIFGIVSLLCAKESLVSDIPAEGGKIVNFLYFLYFLGNFIRNQTENDRYWQKITFYLGHLLRYVLIKFNLGLEF